MVVVVFCLFVWFWFFETGFLCSFGVCPEISSCRPGLSWTHRDSPASASPVLGLKARATTARPFFIDADVFHWLHSYASALWWIFTCLWILDRTISSLKSFLANQSHASESMATLLWHGCDPSTCLLCPSHHKLPLFTFSFPILLSHDVCILYIPGTFQSLWKINSTYSQLLAIYWFNDYWSSHNT